MVVETPLALDQVWGWQVGPAMAMEEASAVLEEAASALPVEGG